MEIIDLMLKPYRTHKLTHFQLGLSFSKLSRRASAETKPQILSSLDALIFLKVGLSYLIKSGLDFKIVNGLDP